MSFGAITKQLAKEVVGDQVQNLLSGGGNAPAPAKAAEEPAAEGLAVVLMGQVQAMQNALKEDQELAVQCSAGGETIRVLEMFAPSTKVLVITGLDRDKALTRIVSPADAVQLICKPATVAAGGKAARMRFVTPKPPSTNKT